MINTTESIREWLITCPAVAEVIGFNTNYLGENPEECSIYSLPSTLRYTEDITGEISYRGTQEARFLFALRTHYSDDVEQNIDNLKFFDEVKEWMYKQNTSKNLPEIAEGTIRSLMPIKTEYISSANADSAMYQMELELKYWREN